MFDVKDTDFFDMEEEAFDTIVENDIAFTGKIKMKKAFMIRGKVNGTIDSTSDLVIDSDAVVYSKKRQTVITFFKSLKIFSCKKPLCSSHKPYGSYRGAAICIRNIKTNQLINTTFGP